MAEASDPPEVSAPSHARGKQLLRDLPADVFMSKIEHFSGPQVTICVQGRDFRLPKDLLCYNSTYFDKKLSIDADGIKAENTTFVLPYGSVETFELVVQWMYMSNIVPPRPIRTLPIYPNGDTREATKEEFSQQQSETNPVELSDNSSPNIAKASKVNAYPDNIAAYLRFFKMADELGLLGPFDLIYRRIKTALIASDRCLLASHIRSAAALRCGHPVRKLFAQSCVVPYVRDVKVQYSREFRFGVELNEIEAFAADLFREYNQVIRQGTTEMEQNTLFFQFTDPLTGKMLRIACTYKRV